MSEILSYLQNPPKKYLFDGSKLIYHQERLQDYLDGKRISPIHIDVGIHKSCNIACIYCYGIKQKPSSAFIPREALLWLARDAHDCGVKSLAIIGDGEPTMNKGLYDFVGFGSSLGLDVSVATNGLLLQRGQIELLCRSLVWLRFNISAVGETYAKIHGTDGFAFPKFDRVLRVAVEEGNKTGCTIGLQMVLIPECFDQIIPLAQYAVDRGVDYLVIKQFSDPGEAIPSRFDLERYKEVEAQLKQAEGMSNERTKIVAKWSAMADSTRITSFKHWEFDRCIDLPFIFQISGDGGCYPCGYLFGNPDYCYGNVIETRLKDILASDRYWNVVQKVKNTPLEKLCKGQCRHCETNKFMDRLTKLYRGNLRESLIEMCNGEENYQRMMNNPPEHINFV